MICKRCGSNNIFITTESQVKVKYRSCLSWLFWIFLALITVGLILIIPLVTNKKIKTKYETVAICQSCGKKWYL